jgi:hypothetical protein
MEGGMIMLVLGAVVVMLLATRKVRFASSLVGGDCADYYY